MFWFSAHSDFVGYFLSFQNSLNFVFFVGIIMKVVSVIGVTAIMYKEVCGEKGF